MPALTITSPKAGLGVSNAMFIATGTARDNAAVASVFYQLNGGDWALADGTTNWTTTIHLAQRSNTLAAYAVDTSGNFSLTNRRTFAYFFSDRLQLATSGLGSVSPNYSNAFLEIGKGYKITARPGAGQVFSNWTGGVFADAGTVFAATNPLSFLMQSNLALNANFVLNPFLPRKGSYNGLFADFSNTNRDQGSSGILTLKLTDRGTYAASLKSGNKQWPATGSFDVGGNSTLPVKRPGTNSLTVALNLDLTSTIGLITGTASDGIWQANLFADRAEFDVRTNPAPFAHKYTLIIPGGDVDGMPVGDGYGTLTVSTSGQIIFIGNLAAVTPSSKTLHTSSNKLTMTVVLPSGKFTGNVTPPGMNNSIPIQGAVFQNTATAYGYFLGTNVSGSVELTAPPGP